MLHRPVEVAGIKRTYFTRQERVRLQPKADLRFILVLVEQTGFVQGGGETLHEGTR